MTDRERALADLGIEYAEGIESAQVVTLPCGREVRKKGDKWEAQPWNDNYWLVFDDIIEAIRFATPPSRRPRRNVVYGDLRF